MERMINYEKARKLARDYFRRGQLGFVSPDTESAGFDCAMKMAQWKDEQHQQSLIDLNCKLEEQQANYEELKKRYDEGVEREKIATKIINELRTKLNNK